MGIRCCEDCGIAEGHLDDCPKASTGNSDLLTIGENEVIHPTQDPKYGIRDNRLVNMATGEPIPDDEPVMIFRAKDVHAGFAIFEYARKCCDADHRDAVAARYVEFRNFARDNPDRMKEPDTVAG